MEEALKYEFNDPPKNKLDFRKRNIITEGSPAHEEFCDFLKENFGKGFIS